MNTITNFFLVTFLALSFSTYGVKRKGHCSTPELGLPLTEQFEANEQLGEVAEESDVEKMKKLLEHHVRVFNRYIYLQRPPLIYAIRNDNPEMVKLLLKHGANPNEICPIAEEPSLVQFILKKPALYSLPIFSNLLKHGANISFRSKSFNNKTIFNYMVENHNDMNFDEKKPHWFELATLAGGKVDGNDAYHKALVALAFKGNPLIQAILLDNTETVSDILANRNNDRGIGLLYAISQGNVTLVELLIGSFKVDKDAEAIRQAREKAKRLETFADEHAKLNYQAIHQKLNRLYRLPKVVC
ncbi:MAG TPA: hypothetical protein VHA52_04380 [Candidatus Babeliaceae bacterium]|nr:hypothetical protein [Candidatus Babeliaceae bacterium]